MSPYLFVLTVEPLIYSSHHCNLGNEVVAFVEGGGGYRCNRDCSDVLFFIDKVLASSLLFILCCCCRIRR